MLSCFILQLLFLLSSFTVLNYGQLTYGYTGYNVMYNCSTEVFSNTDPFQANLNEFLKSLPNATGNNFFFNNTVGEAPKQVYGLAWCYNLTPLDSNICTNCIVKAVGGITMNCSSSIYAAIWFEQCFVRYSNVNFFTAASTDFVNSVHSGNTGEGVQFKEDVTKLMNNLTNEAASSPKRIAVDQKERRDSVSSTPQYIWGLSECTRDLTALECEKCLTQGITWIYGEDECWGFAGCRVYGFSCYLRYESRPFYLPIEPSPPPPSIESPPPPSPGKKKLVTTYATVAVACVTVLLLTITGVLFWMRRQGRTEFIGNQERRHHARSTVDSNEAFRHSTELIIFDFETLQNATGNFSNENKLGEGGFGQVFKGTLKNGLDIAVKRMSQTSVHGVAELKNEVELLVRLKHRNLVQVLGCCMEDDEKLLCYEYLPNGSLDRILFASDSARHEELDWETRFKIIEGICHGLVYLHDESRFKIIHRDLKASNILLDTSMNPKISDFGLARLFREDQTHKSTTKVAGTFGYMAPEYLLNLMFSVKSDVFSFGVLILEIITGRRCRTNLISFVWEHWANNEVSKIKDSALPDMYLDEATKCIHIGLLCVQQHPDQRPSISQVNIMLDRQSTIVLPALPPRTSIWGAQLVPVSEDIMNIDSTSCSTEYIMETFNHDHSSQQQ